MKPESISRLIRQTAMAVVAVLGLAQPAQADSAHETRYPVVFAHGMAGWDSILGYHYFGDDLTGVFVGDACSFLELNGCNPWIAEGQQSHDKAQAFAVTGLQNSEVRGSELYEQVRNFLAVTGYAKVNFVGHSQGGMDIRKAAHLLKATYGTSKVASMMSISSPHRGTGIAKKILDTYARKNGSFCGALPTVNGADPCADAALKLANLAYNVVNMTGGGSSAKNDAIASFTQFVYEDYDANDGKVTGARAFNLNYPMTSAVADYYGSVITGQDNASQNLLLQTLGSLLGGYNQDGDGYCVEDCDHNGAAGTGNGNAYDMDDDGLVPINSQQMGYRLQYNPNDFRCTASLFGVCLSWVDPLDTLTEVSTTGYVANLNAPSSTQMTSRAGVLAQDHLDVISLGPDTFDENEFYASMMEYMYQKGY